MSKRTPRDRYVAGEIEIEEFERLVVVEHEEEKAADQRRSRRRRGKVQWGNLTLLTWGTLWACAAGAAIAITSIPAGVADDLTDHGVFGWALLGTLLSPFAAAALAIVAAILLFVGMLFWEALGFYYEDDPDAAAGPSPEERPVGPPDDATRFAVPDPWPPAGSTTEPDVRRSR